MSGEPAPEARAHFRRCSTCKDPIAFEARYFTCSVSTCNRKRMTLVFCSVGCWDAHQADARHRDAFAEEAKAPTRAVWERETNERARADREPERTAPSLHAVSHYLSHDVLVVGTRVKAYIEGRAGMSTSERAFGVLSDNLRSLLDLAIAAAGRDGRKTVMDRDLEPLTRSRAQSLATGAPDRDDRPNDIIVVVTKVKEYVKARSGMNTSDSVAKLLSAHLRRVAREAIRKAAMDDRKTVLDRDVVAALRRDTSG